MTMDFMEQELHVRLEHQVDGSDIMKLTFFYEHHWHEMQRPRDESMQKTFGRMAKTIAKTHKSKRKTKRTKDLRATQGNSAAVAQESNDDRTDCQLLHNGQVLAATTLSNNDFQTGMIVQLCEVQWTVVVNPPTIAHLASFPRSHYTLGYPIVPIVVSEYATHFNCQWLHETSAGSGDYELVSEQLVFTPSIESVHKRVKLVATPYRDERVDSGLEPQQHSRVFGRPVVFYLSRSVLPPSPLGALPRSLQLREEFYRPLPPPSSTFPALRVMTYNVLSEGYALKEQASNPLYHYCDDSYLELEYRGQLIAQELLQCHADVIALQECDRKLFTNYLLPLLGQAGYEGHFTNKVSMVQEGCALFLRQRSLRVLQWIDLPYKHSLQANRSTLAKDLYAQRPDLQEILGGKLGTIAQIAVVAVLPQESSSSSSSSTSCLEMGERVLCIANTHLFYHPLASYLRLLQAHALTSYLSQFLLPSLRSSSNVQTADISGWAKTRNERRGDGNDSVNSFATESSCPQDAAAILADPIDVHWLEEERRLRLSLLPPGPSPSQEGQTCLNHPGDLVDSSLLPSISHLTLVPPRFSSSATTRETAVVILGDLNATPSSPAFAFLRDGQVDAASLARVWEELSAFAWNSDSESTSVNNSRGTSPLRRPGEISVGPISTDRLVHSLALVDTCQAWDPSVVTNFVPCFQERLDHIFVSSCLEVVDVAPMPSRAILEEEVALPSSGFPSDHISVVVDLAWR